MLKSVGDDPGANGVSKMGYANLRSKGFIIPSRKGELPFLLWSSEKYQGDRYVWVLSYGFGDLGIMESKDDAYLLLENRLRNKNPVHCVKD